jgi:hypothetical protein
MAWKIRGKSFPWRGKKTAEFSTVWKILLKQDRHFFHGVENGRKIFHGVENGGHGLSRATASRAWRVSRAIWSAAAAALGKGMCPRSRRVKEMSRG